MAKVTTSSVKARAKIVFIGVARPLILRSAHATFPLLVSEEQVLVANRVLRERQFRIKWKTGCAQLDTYAGG